MVAATVGRNSQNSSKHGYKSNYELMNELLFAAGRLVLSLLYQLDRCQRVLGYVHCPSHIICPYPCKK